MRILRSYYVTVILVAIFSLLMLFDSLINKFTQTIESNISRLAVYERDFDYTRLASQLVKLNAKAEEYRITPQSQEEVLENFLALADVLNQRFKISAKTDRPIDTNSTLSLGVSFSAEFNNEKEFMTFVRQLVAYMHPVITFDRLMLQEVKDRNHAADFQIQFVEPYVRGHK